MHLDIEYIRSQFPALKREVNGFPAVYFDAPGGTQVPQRVIDRMVDYLTHQNANTGGVFETSIANDRMIRNAREAFADFFGCSWNEVSFGENSTTINFKLSQAIARDIQPGDEIIITEIDHDSNRSPWKFLEDRGAIIKDIRVDPKTLVLDMDDFRNQLSAKTKLVAFNYASNAVGTISDAKEIIRLAHDAGAFTVVDAVHFALHGVIDVKALDVDFLFCSAYKFFGPHVGVLYSKAEKLTKLRSLKVSAQKNQVPEKFETGTLNHEGLAGAAEALEFIADAGSRHPELLEENEKGFSERRKKLICGMRAFEEHEMPLAGYFKDELSKISGLTLYTPPREQLCTSTISFRIKNIAPLTIAKQLAEKGIFVWAGGFYAVALMKLLGLDETGGMVRIGLAPYNTLEEIQRTLQEIHAVASHHSVAVS